MHTPSGEAAKRYAKAGFDMATAGLDGNLLAEAARRQIAAARGGGGER